MPNPKPTRADDDRLLSMVAARSKGLSSREVGQVVGLEREAVRTAVNRVRAADLAESGENRGAVMAAYWGGA